MNGFRYGRDEEIRFDGTIVRVQHEFRIAIRQLQARAGCIAPDEFVTEPVAVERKCRVEVRNTQTMAVHFVEECGHLDARKPFVTAVFPIATLPAGQFREARDDLDAHHVLCVFVPELPFDAQTQRCAIGNR